MKKLLLPLTFISLLMSANVVAQQTNKATNKTNKVQRKGPKVSKNNAVIRINEVPARQSAVTRSSNRNNTRKQRIVETNTSSRKSTAKKVSHREMIAKRKRIVDNY